jgi:hypothetical protein
MKFPNENIRGFARYRFFSFLFRRFRIYKNQQYYQLLPIIYKADFVPNHLIFEFLGKRYCWNIKNKIEYNHHLGAIWKSRYPYNGTWSFLFCMNKFKKAWNEILGK